MRVYKFISRKFGLEAIQNRRIKISQIEAANDLYELLPFDLSDPVLRRKLLKSRRDLSKGKGFLCFSSSWDNPVLWAHYSESHTGLCLGFEIPDDLPQAVEYFEIPTRLDVNNLDLTMANRMLFTKYSDWKYEREMRVWSTLEDKIGEHYFHDFDERIRLAEVLLGARCDLTFKELKEHLGSFLDGIRIRKVRAAYAEFKMVVDEEFKTED